MSQLLDLPFELIHLIVECFHSKHDINALVQTCRFFYDTYDSYLYRYDMQYCNRSALRWAACRGFDKVAAKSLAAGRYIEEASELDGSTPLLLAVRHGNADIVKRLLLLGSRVRLEAWDWWSGRTALAEAAANGEAEIARLLLEKGASLETTDRDYRSPLLLAVENGHDEVVKVLLNQGAAVNSRGKHYQTPLSSASERGHLGCVDILLDHGAKIGLQDRNGRTELFHAANQGHGAVVKRLTDAGANPY
ncbi:ankyrin repeat-containing domain protein [Aspergillus pseudoustus]|uniref:Ankyrin repeat-containing domain protein n=1 Tax=Aspergillus pseudoustus TaxID=1810923 RepID=A0ABR4KGP4_9EURO